jgi:hypothetical protein
MNILKSRHSKRIEANLLERTVEGEQSPLAYALRDGSPLIDARGVHLGSDVDLRLLIDFLRSKRPISREIRNWLANMLDEGVPTNANLILKRRRGQPKKNMLEYLEAVEAFVERRDAGDTYESALYWVVTNSGIKEGTLKKAVAALEDGVRIYMETARET